MRKSNKKLGEIVMEILRVLYANSSPKCNFDMLVENSPIGEDGRKQIPYDDYEINEDLMRSIVNTYIKKNRLTKREQDIIKFNVYLGPSPKTKIGEILK